MSRWPLQFVLWLAARLARVRHEKERVRTRERALLLLEQLVSAVGRAGKVPVQQRMRWGGNSTAACNNTYPPVAISFTTPLCLGDRSLHHTPGLILQLLVVPILPKPIALCCK